MSHNRSTMRWLVALALAMAPALVAAQTPGVLSGVVRETAGGRPLGNALIVLDPLGATRNVRADSTGRFRFTRVSSGRHELRTVWIGYVADSQTVTMVREGLDIVIELRPLPFQLDTVPIVATRSGIYGTVISRKGFVPLGRATVRILGARASDTTAAAGQFNFPQVREGAYVVRVLRDGFRSWTRSVVVPHKGGIELAAVLDTVSSKGTKTLESLWRDFDRRQEERSINNSAMVPRQELAGHESQSLGDALRYSVSFLSRGLVLDETACVFVDGVARPMVDAWDFRASDVELVEVYGVDADRTGH